MHVPISMRDILGGAHDENRSGDKGIQSRSTSLFQIEQAVDRDRWSMWRG